MKIVEDIKILWRTNAWDGPTEGVCEYEDSPHLFKLIKEINKMEDFRDEGETPKIVWNDTSYDFQGYACRLRLFGIYRLTSEELESQEYWHSEFKKYVRDGSNLKPESLRPKFYDRYKVEYKKPSLSNMVAIYVELILND